MLNRLFQAAVITFLLSLLVGGTSLKLSKVSLLMGNLLTRHISYLIPRPPLNNQVN
jgi:hypothetical protein